MVTCLFQNDFLEFDHAFCSFCNISLGNVSLVLVTMIRATQKEHSEINTYYMNMILYTQVNFSTTPVSFSLLYS